MLALKKNVLELGQKTELSCGPICSGVQSKICVTFYAKALVDSQSLLSIRLLSTFILFKKMCKNIILDVMYFIKLLLQMQRVSWRPRNLKIMNVLS